MPKRYLRAGQPLTIGYESDAQIMIARSAIETGNEQLAETAFAEVKKIATGQTAWCGSVVL